MKSSINFLPAEKRRDLHQLVEIIRNEIKDCVMIILYGSYARIHTSIATAGGLRSDDLFHERLRHPDRHAPTARIEGIRRLRPHHRTVFANKQSEFYTRPQFINESISRLNKNLELGQYFYHEIKSRESCSTPRRSSNWHGAGS